VTNGPTYNYAWSGLGAGSYTVRSKATERTPDGREFVSNFSNGVALTVGAATPPGLCVATSASQMHACIGSLQQGLINSIRVDGIIDCTETAGKGGSTPCRFRVANIVAPQGAPFRIFGSASTPSGFVRSGALASTFNTPVLDVFRVENLEVRDLSFDDGHAVFPVGSIGAGAIHIFESTNITLSDNEFANSKFSAIAMRSNNGVDIFDSTFSDIQVFAIWGAEEANQVSSNVRIRGNEFLRTYNNAIIASLVDSSITDNVFIGNHYVPLFGVSGGQFVVEKNSSNVLVGCNSIHDSAAPGYPNANGLELAPYNLSDIRIIGNVIYNHDGYGISINHDNVNVSNIVIRGNSLSNNTSSPHSSDHPLSLGGQIDFDFPDFIPTLTNNCTNGTCLESCETNLLGGEKSP
jgi:hypothetical protein